MNPSIAKELIFTGAAIDGAHAKEIGMVNHVVCQNEDGDAAYQKCIEIAEQIVPNVRNYFMQVSVLKFSSFCSGI